MTLDAVLQQTLLLFALGFLIANFRAGLELLRWLRRRRSALVVWPAPKPPFYALSLGVGVLLGLLILLKAYLALAAGSRLGEWFPVFARNTVGELMMFVYFGYMLPLSTRITRGLYAEGIWTDSGFVHFETVAGISWRGDDAPTLVVIARRGSVARRMRVPATMLSEVRRVLRDKIASHAISMDEGPGLHLGVRDARDSV